MDTGSSTDAVAEIAAAYFAATRAMDEESWLATFDPGATAIFSGSPPVKGHQALREVFQLVVAGFDRVTITDDLLIVSGNSAAAKWTGRGLAKDGRTVTFEGIDVIEVNDEGLIQTLWTFWRSLPSGRGVRGAQ